MCGILGAVCSRNCTEGLASFEHFRSALDMMYDRGPDASNIVRLSDDKNFTYGYLGHRRLAIIETSAASNQPLTSFCGDYVIVFNGELYNYIEIREELISLGYGFNTNSDTEVLLNAWISWGPRCLHKFTGMFAAAIFNIKKRELFVIRDAFGIKPLFFAYDSKKFVFGSSLASIFKIAKLAPNINYQSVFNFLSFGICDNVNESFVEGINVLEPGSYLQVCCAEPMSVKYNRWWFPDISVNENLKWNDAVEFVREEFLSSVKMHMRSDVPLGATLSGGLDSSSIVYAMRFIDPEIDIHTFSFIDSNIDNSEEKWIDFVNNDVGSICHKVKAIPNRFVADLDNLISAHGEPFNGASIYAQYCVYKEVSAQGIKVALDGQGGDEVFAGYDGYPGKLMSSMLSKGSVVDAVNFLRNWASFPGHEIPNAIQLLCSEYLPASVDDWLRDWRKPVSSKRWMNYSRLLELGVALERPRFKAPVNCTSDRKLAGELALSLSTRGLRQLLRHGDRNSMRFSVESRVPFLTLSLAKYTLQLPENFLVSDKGESKHIFRHAMRGIVPDEILFRKDKIGFKASENDLINFCAEDIKIIFKNAHFDPCVNSRELLNILESFFKGRREFGNIIWRAYIYLRWKNVFSREAGVELL